MGLRWVPKGGSVQGVCPRRDRQTCSRRFPNVCGVYASVQSNRSAVWIEADPLLLTNGPTNGPTIWLDEGAHEHPHCIDPDRPATVGWLCPAYR
jgi:hypothetical protein